MKKIVIFSNMYPSENHPTFGIFVKNQVEQLRNEKLNIEVIAINEPGKGKVLTLKKYLSWFMKSMFYLLKNKKNIGLTHAHYAFPTGLLSLIGKKLFKIPYVVTIHGGDIDKMPSKHPKIKQMTAKILKNADRVIAVGERLKHNIVNDFHIPENQVEVLSMGVDTDVFTKTEQSTARESLGLNHEEKMILFVGNIIREKGISELMQAFARIQDAFPESALYLMGAERNENFSEELRAIAKKHQLTNIHFKQPVDQEALAKWMAAADLLALPSYHEGFGLVALEAMATGTAVVGTDVGGLSYLLQDEAGILVQPKDIDSLANGLEKGLVHEGFSEQKMTEMVQKHSTTMVIQKLLATYRDVER